MKRIIHQITRYFSMPARCGVLVEGVFRKGKNVLIENSEIRIGKKGTLTLGDGVIIRNYKIVVEEGHMSVGHDTILEQANNALVPSIHINKGSFTAGHHNLIRADFSIRYEGRFTLGNYNCINEETEIRCDEQVSIGDFNMISYECMIYDTNCHVIYPPETRRQMTVKDFPSIGAEHEKPVSKPVSIGNDCWLGKRSVILKGVSVGNHALVGACAVVTASMPADHIARGNPARIDPNTPGK